MDSHTLSQETVFVTGGAGFIGSRLCQRLAAAGNRVIAYDNLHPQVHGPGQSSFDFGSQPVEFIQGDVNDFDTMRQCIQQAMPRVVYHMAAETGTGQSMEQIRDYTATNVQGTSNLLEIVNDTGSVRSLILPSSRSIYGEGAFVDANGIASVGLTRTRDAMERGDFEVYNEQGGKLTPVLTTEACEPRPVSIYASTKLMQEFLVQQGGINKHWKATILRFQNVYGPGQSLLNPYTGVLSIFSTQILSNASLNIYEDGEIYRDFVYVDDVVDALELSANSRAPHGQAVNIGSGQAVRILDVAMLLMGEYGKNTDNFRISGDFRDGDIKYACADISLALSALGWQPKTGLDQGLKALAKVVLKSQQKSQDLEVA